jgi:hypothetical protein
MKPAACNVFKMSSIEHISGLERCIMCGNEKQGTHEEADILRALSHLWRSDQGSL